MDLLKSVACIAVIAASVVYLNNQYAEHKLRVAAATELMASATERAAADARMRNDFSAWAEAHHKR